MLCVAHQFITVPARMHSTLPTSNVAMRSARVSAAPHAQPRIRTPAATLRAIKLYTNPGTRGKMADWALAELGLQYEEVLVDMKKGQHKTPEYLAIHPFGMVPALVDDDQSIFESGAILLHLANKYGKYTPDQLGTAAQWVLFSNSTFSEAFFVKGPSQSSGRLLQVVDGILAKNTYITGETFSIADVALAGYLLYLPMFFPDLEVPGNIWRYMELCASRPGCPAPYKQAVEQAKARNAGPASVFSRIMGKK